MDKLLQEVKDHLNITWDEEETNRKIERIIKDAIAILNWKLGAEIDYSEEEGQEHNLLLDYCMYAYNQCTNEFDNNYFNEIMQIRQKYEVIQYEQSK
jgi:hypothetical protein